MKKKYFTFEECPSRTGKYLIRPIHENFFLGPTTGSYNIICARVLNLSYAQYLRMCRDLLGAEIEGKGHKYPLAYFKLDKNLHQLVNLLNARAELIVWEREHPQENLKKD